MKKIISLVILLAISFFTFAQSSKKVEVYLQNTKIDFEKGISLKSKGNLSVGKVNVSTGLTLLLVSENLSGKKRMMQFKNFDSQTDFESFAIEEMLSFASVGDYLLLELSDKNNKKPAKQAQSIKIKLFKD